MDWYTLQNIDQTNTPALVVFPDRVEENIRLLTTMIDDPGRLRPHIKTHKAMEPVRMMINHGIRKFKCATIAEAEMLGMIPAEDVLLAYQPVGPKVDRFIALIRKYPFTQFSCLIDNRVSLEHISRTAIRENVSVSVYIDLNVGMNRTGIAPGQEAYQLYQECLSMKNIRFRGLHAYDGHIHDKDLEQRKIKCMEAFSAVKPLLEKIRSENNDPVTLVAGGTPTFPIHSQIRDRECSPGTFIYWDKGYQDACPEQPFLIAALLVTRVISMPAPEYLCLDLGYKSIASEKSPEDRFTILNPGNFQVVSQSEEHVVVDAGKNHGYTTGDVFYIVPKHICPTVAVYEKAHTARVRVIDGEWKTMARDRKIQC